MCKIIETARKVARDSALDAGNVLAICGYPNCVGCNGRLCESSPKGGFDGKKIQEIVHFVGGKIRIEKFNAKLKKHSALAGSSAD